MDLACVYASIAAAFLIVGVVSAALWAIHREAQRAIAATTQRLDAIETREHRGHARYVTLALELSATQRALAAATSERRSSDAPLRLPPPVHH